MAVTILDVAKEAGVSIGTVSRYMADPEQVNKVNQKNIAKAIEKLEFIPNNYARHLKRGTTNIVGFITPDITQELFNKVAKALNQILIEYGYLLIICDSEESPKKEKQLVNTLLQQNAALIIIASSGQNEKFLATVAEKNPKKIMLFDRMVPDVPTECLCEDNVFNAYKLVNNLIIHDVLIDSQYVVLSGTDYSPITRYRLQGVEKAFKEHNIVLDDEKVIKNLCTTAKTKEVVMKLLSSPFPPKVIIFTNPKCIFGILQACWQLNINIGEDLKIAGFSSTSIRTQFNIDAPCVIQDSQEIGRRLGNFAVARIKNPHNTIIPKTIFIDSLVEDIYPIKNIIKEHNHDFAIISPKIDHTQLKPYSTITDIEKLCHEAMEFQFACACINGCWAPVCRDILKGTDIKVGVAVGFPLGAMATDVKVCEAKTAILQGSNEIDMVMNIGFLKDKKYKDVELDIKKVKEVCKNIDLKVILETCLLTDEEKRIACEIAVQAGATFVKTSTGFSTGGATIHDIELMRKTVGPTIGVKASGGIHTYQAAREMLNAGASRIGTISSVAIMEEAKKFLV